MAEAEAAAGCRTVEIVADNTDKADNNGDHTNNNSSNSSSNTSNNNSSSSSSTYSAPSSMYANAVCLAPMVRGGTLPTRLRALRCGADLVWSEELIDHKLINCTRVVNARLNTVDFVTPDNTLVFRTCGEETSRVILQIGTSDPNRAVQAAKLVENDVAGIDVNMGCPKDFSLKGGMGAALLKQPALVKDIVSALTANIKKPITCKIRVLPSYEETLSLARIIESCGAAAIGVHARLTQQRPREAVRPEYLAHLQRLAQELRIPVIANGGSLDIKSHADVLAFRKAAGCSSVMVARAAQYNMSVFRAEGLLPPLEMVAEYLRTAIACGNPYPNTKYNVLAAVAHDHDLHTRVLATRSTLEMCELFGLADHYRTHWVGGPEDAEAQAALDAALLAQDEAQQEQEQQHKRRRVFTESHIELDASFDVRDYPAAINPKVYLRMYAHKHGVENPVYDCTVADNGRRITCTCAFAGKTFASLWKPSNKKQAEQAAARVCLLSLGLMTGTTFADLETSASPSAILASYGAGSNTS
eukprot:m.115437 g.115437  ORF g.115437 m.115437 type:complete len:529 (+) comp16049_c0_seq1:125-1711(+)